ncbi:MAG: glycosyltransferase [Candidatus Hodarchaeota archaeon]
MFKRKSLLFVNPDYHCSFVLRDEFRKLGWRTNVFTAHGYPDKLLYKNEGLSVAKFEKMNIGFLSKERFIKLINLFIFMFAFFRYRYFLFYGTVGTVDVLPVRLDKLLRRFLDDDFRLSLELGKVFGKKFLYLPSGCLGEELQSEFSKLDNGKVCSNCGVLKCDDSMQIPRFKVLRRYGDFFFGNGTFNSTQIHQTHVRYKSLDLNLWHPGIKVPRKFMLKPTKSLRVLHSFYEGGRNAGGKNIKGSGYVFEAVKKLREERYPVEYYFIRDVESKYMRYYQVQADIVVDQLIYGWWGSTGIETMALGKPVVCYLRKEWKDNFLRTFPEYESFPVVEATTETIYEVLKKLVTDEEYRKKRGAESRAFAEKHFDAKKNAAEMEKMFLNL